MSQPGIPERRDFRVPFLAILLITLGVALFLDRLDVIALRWGRVIWTCIAVYGAALIVMAFMNRRKGTLTWGNILFFFGGLVALYQWRVIPRDEFYALPLLCVALGFSFLISYFYSPGNPVLLIPAFLFIGFGVVFYMWWWDYIDWFDFRYYARRYWPVLLIVLGTAIAVRKK